MKCVQTYSLAKLRHIVCARQTCVTQWIVTVWTGKSINAITGEHEKTIGAGTIHTRIWFALVYFRVTIRSRIAGGARTEIASKWIGASPIYARITGTLVDGVFAHRASVIIITYTRVSTIEIVLTFTMVTRIRSTDVKLWKDIKPTLNVAHCNFLSCQW